MTGERVILGTVSNATMQRMVLVTLNAALFKPSASVEVDRQLLCKRALHSYTINVF